MTDQEKVLGSTTLPSLPDVVVRLLEVSADPEAGMREVLTVVRADAGMSARIVKAVNSPYFGLNTEVSSLENAVPLLGTNAVVSLALSFSLIEEKQTPFHKALWSQSLLRAVASEYIARECKFPAPCDFFMAGLLSDIGVLAMLNAIADEYVPVCEASKYASLPLCECEQKAFGFTHVDIGLELAKRWALPSPLVRAIASHHLEIDEVVSQSDDPKYSLIKTVRFANCLSEYVTNQLSDETRNALQECGERCFNFDREKIDDIVFKVREFTEEAAAVMCIDTNDLPPAAELLVAANARLVDISLRNQVAMNQVVQKNEELKEKTVRDGLTEIHNRLAFDDRYSTTVHACLENGGGAGVIFCDIDEFKKLNDTYGHPFGDEVLRRVAKTLEGSVRDTDFVARYGGEEFVVIALECEPQILLDIAERMRKDVEAEEIEFEGKRIPVTISVGGCAATQAGGRKLNGAIADIMLREADSAMYRCKRNGRNQVEVVQIGERPDFEVVINDSPPEEPATLPMHAQASLKLGERLSKVVAAVGRT